MRFRALLFDLDGTLVDSHHEICLALDKALIDSGFHLDFARVEQLVDGSPLEVIWAKVAPDDTLENSPSYQHFADSYRAHYMRDLGHATALFPGVLDTLTALRTHLTDTPCAVVSNKSAKAVMPLLRAVAIDHHFDLALGSGGTNIAPKPSPELLLHAASALRCEAPACAMIGDTVFDVLAGKRASMRTFAFSYGMSSREKLAEVGADHLLDRFSELQTLLLA